MSTDLDGRMMDFPLTITHLLERARALFPSVELVTQRPGPDKTIVRQSYAATYARGEQLARALRRLGVARGDRVATLSWNHHEHVECYFAIPAAGYVIHTLNLRLHPDELAYIAAHAEDSVVIVDRTLFSCFEKFRDRIPTLRHVIVIRDDGGPLPDGTHDYEALLAAEPVSARGPVNSGMSPPADSPFAGAVSDERAAAMICYTSGTTGNPKGVAYTHRSIVLHTFALALTDSMGLCGDDTVLPVVPMFHAMGWGLPFGALTVGAKLVLPGPHLDPPSLLDLMARERATLVAGVPTIWIGILAELDRAPTRWDVSSVRSMIIGGAAAPPALIEGFAARHQLHVMHAWGMTETNPVGTLARVTPAVRARGPEAAAQARASQGVPVPFVELRHVADDGRILPWDGATMGELEVRGPWVASSYVGDEGRDRFTGDGWFKTGDVVTIDGDGYVRITDRAKDVIKSGGEWISSVALENALMGHPAVLEAAVFGIAHPKWSERPVAAIALKPGQTATGEELRAALASRFARFWLPDAFVFVTQIPRTSTGKFLKTQLRKEYAELFANERC
jgi:fatty-acyl-CoA synthase